MNSWSYNQAEEGHGQSTSHLSWQHAAHILVQAFFNTCSIMIHIYFKTYILRDTLKHVGTLSSREWLVVSRPVHDKEPRNRVHHWPGHQHHGVTLLRHHEPQCRFSHSCIILHLLELGWSLAWSPGGLQKQVKHDAWGSTLSMGSRCTYSPDIGSLKWLSWCFQCPNCANPPDIDASPTRKAALSKVTPKCRSALWYVFYHWSPLNHTIDPAAEIQRC